MKLSPRPLRRKDYWDKSRDEIINAILTDTLNKNEELDIEDDYRKSTIMLGDYVTLDWPHIQNIHNIRSTIINYANDPSRRRPLNIIMVAQAGSGKSYLVNQLAKKISSTRVGAVSFNMSNLVNIDDLVQPLDAVRNMKVIDLLPILFLDEFDSNPSKFSLLLPLLWDGELHIGHRDLKLGKVVIILAGSDLEIKKIMHTAKGMQRKYDNEQEPQKDNKKKLFDLLSRINGGMIEIPDLELDTKDRNRRVDKICIAISLLQKRFGAYLQLVPWRLLRFIAITEFRYGIRSIASLIDLIPYKIGVSASILNSDLKLPLNSLVELKKSSLAYHLIASDDPQTIVDNWLEFAECDCLVRFKSFEEDDI